MNEVFKNVKIRGFEHYKVSNTGKVLNTKNNKLLAGIAIPNKLKGSVQQIQLHNKDKHRNIMVHILVFMHFKKEEIAKNWIWHKDVNGMNNNENNLDLNSRGEYKRKCAIIKNKKRGVYSFNQGKTKFRSAVKVNDRLVTLGYTKVREDAEILYEFGYEMIFGEAPYKIAA